MAVEPGDMPLMLPFHDSRFWYHALIGQMSSCWQIRSAVDSIALFQCHAPAISAEDFLKQILSKQYKFLCKTFHLSLLQEEQKICLWSVAKRKTKHSTNQAFLALSSDKLRSHLQSDGLIKRRSNGTALQSRSWQQRDKTQKSRMTMAKSHACKKETSARRLVQR